MTKQQITLIEEIKTIAKDQLGDWLGVDPVYQPAAIHRWQEVYDYACQTAAWESDQLGSLKRENHELKQMLRDVDQSAPAALEPDELGLDLAAALETVREWLGE